MTNIAKIFNIHTINSLNGSLSNIQLDDNLQFECKNIFYIYNVKNNAIRGNHAHKTCNEILITINGCCEVTIDDGINQTKFTLDSPNKYLYIPSKNWITYQIKSNNCILLALSSEVYNKLEYIYDYNEFIVWKNMNI